MSKISKMPLKDILKQTDVIMRDNDIIFFCDDVEVIKMFVEKYKNGTEDRQGVKQFLVDNEEHIDKEKFLLLTVRNYKENIKIFERYIAQVKQEDDKSKDKFTTIANIRLQLHQQKENLEKAIKLGKGIETVLTYYYYDEKNKRYKVEVVDSREFIDGKNINYVKGLKRFDEVDFSFKDPDSKEQFGLEYVLQAVLLTDLYNVFPSEQFGNDIRTMILENEALKKKIKTREQLENLKTLESYEEYTTIVDGIEFDGLLPDIKETLREYATYIDMDKLLLISAYRFQEALESERLDSQMHMGVKEILQGILSNIKGNNAQIVCKLQSKKDYELIPITYSTKDIKKCISRFSQSTYLSTTQIADYREKVSSQKNSLLEINDEYIDVIFSQKELEALSTLSAENLIYVSQKYGWDASRIIELYESDSISLSFIQQIKDSIDLSNSISFEQLNLYYQNMNDNIDDKEAFNQYKKYLELYKEVCITEKGQKELEEISNQIIEAMVEVFEGKKYDQAIKDYFKEGLLTLTTVAEWTDENFITKLNNEGLISLKDIEMLVKEEKLPLEYLNTKYIELINNEEMEYNERLKLIRSGYVQEESIFDLFKRNLIFENDLIKLGEEGFVRNREMQRVISSRTMEELEKNSAIRLTGLNRLTKKNHEIYSPRESYGDTEQIKETGKYIIDPNERERFLRLLRAYKANTDLNIDSPFYNYEFYVIPDETGTIGLNSVVIAERYYEDKDTQRRFATDNATYFFKYKDLMVLSNLKKTEMTKERKNIVFTANHVMATQNREGSWGKSVLSSLAKTFMSCDIKEYSRKNQQIIVRQKLKDIYTPQELNEILNMAAEIDYGSYNGVIEEIGTTKVSKTSKKIEDISDDREAR